MSLMTGTKRWAQEEKGKKENFAICWDELKDTVETNEKESIGKSESLFNQQETEKGSSETYTQSTSKDQEKGPTKDSAKPAHKKEYTREFKEWLVGFTEGDGSFVVNNETSRVSFIITQKDPKVLYFIKKGLGYGKVYSCGDTYWRYVVGRREHIEYIIHLFSGQLKLDKTNERYRKWVEAYTRYYKVEKAVTVIQGEQKIDNKSAWLSGLIDASGSFSASERSGRSTFRMRLSIKQKGEYEKMKQLEGLAGPEKKWGRVTLRGDIAIAEVESIEMLKYIIKYLGRYPLQSRKKIAYVKWLKLLRVVEEGGRGKDYETIKKMAQSINTFEDEEKVQP